MATYKDELTRAMDFLGRQENMRFVGYNVKYGSKANGTLVNVPTDTLIETPVAENLVAGLGIGYALRGHPVLTWIERFDFMLNAFDAIINHADKINQLSEGEFSPNVIFRTIVGSKKKPLFTGATHVQDFSDQLQTMVDFPVVRLVDPKLVYLQYERAFSNLSTQSAVMVEYRELYDAVL